MTNWVFCVLQAEELHNKETSEKISGQCMCVCLIVCVPYQRVFVWNEQTTHTVYTRTQKPHKYTTNTVQQSVLW
jgi:hypothetical protein